MPETSEILAAILQSMASQFAKRVNEIMGELNSAVSAIAGGLRTAMTSIVNGLTGITSVIGRGLTSSIGAVTSSITTILGSLGGGLDTASGFIVNILSSAVGAIGTGLSAAVEVVTEAVNFITGAIGNGFSLALNLVTGAVGAVTSLISSGFASALGLVVNGLAQGLAGVVSFLSGAVTAVAGMLTTAFKGAAEMFSQVATGFVNAVVSSVSALETFSANVTSIADQTGMSRDASLGLVNQFNALGISSAKSAAIFNGTQFSPQLFNQRAVALGAPKLDAPNFGPALATWFQNQAKQGPFGVQSAQVQLNALFGGKAPAEILRLVNSDPATLKRETAYNSSVQSQLGINGNVVKSASEDLPLLQNRITTFIDAVKIKFAAELLPSLQAGFGMVSKIFLDNSGAIVGVLKNFGHWAFVNLPDLAIQGALAIIQVGKWIGDTFFNIAGAAISLLRSFGNQQGPLFGIISAGADFIDFLTEFGAMFKATLAAVATMILNEIAALMHIVPGLSAIISKFDPKLAAAMSQFASPADAFKQTLQASQANWSAHGMLQKYTSGLNSSKVADQAQQANDARRKSFDGGISTVEGVVQNVQNKLGTTAQRDAEYQQRMIGYHEKLVDNTGHMIRVLVDKNGHPLLTSRDVLERMGAYLAQDTARLSRRRG